MNNEGINGVFIMKERMLNMCKNIVFLVCMFCCVDSNLQGQVQQGIVRTALRPNRDSVRIPGVSIRQKGNSNMVVSDSNGVFDILLTGVKIGDPFYLSSVRKMGYELADAGIIGKAFPFSPRVPVEVVMLNIQEKEEDKQRIIDNAYQQAEKEYKSRCAFLEKQLEEKSLSEDKYREELQKLKSDYEGFEALISPMAERYASMDYASIDNLNMEISIAIEEGNLEKADSLISTAGSLADKVKQSQEAMDNVRQRKELGREIIEKAEKDSVDIKRNNEYLADLLYSKYCICLSMFERDSAAYYIQLRANLDTTNAEWQIDAGWFVGQYLADYEQALILFQRFFKSFFIGKFYYEYGAYLQIPQILMFAIIGTVSFLLARKMKNKAFGIANTVYSIVIIFGFGIAMLILYIFSFSYRESLGIAAYPRYMSAMTIGVMLVLATQIIEVFVKPVENAKALEEVEGKGITEYRYGVKKLGIATIAYLVVAASFTAGLNAYIEQNVLPVKVAYGSYKEWIEITAKLDDTDSVYYAMHDYEEDDVYVRRYIKIRFFCTPTRCSGFTEGGSYASGRDTKIFLTGNPFSMTFSAEKFEEETAPYKYLFIDKVSQKFIEQYGSLFEETPKAKVLYLRTEKDGKTVFTETDID